MNISIKVGRFVFVLFFLQAAAFCAAALKAAAGDNDVRFLVIDENTTDKMMLLPKVALKSNTDESSISTGKGLYVYNTSTISGSQGLSPGYYMWNGNRWVRVPYQPENISVSGSFTRSDDNTAYGAHTLRRSAIGGPNTAFGYSALSDVVTGSQNTAVGYCALRTNATGSQNVGVGQGALFNNGAGSGNTAIGLNGLYSNSIGSNNTALGHAVLTANVAGINNTGVGQAALQNATGSNNTAVGHCADLTKESGNNCTAIGAGAVTGNNSDCVQVGNSEIVSVGGQLAWSSRSDKRIKTIVSNNVPGLDFVKQLKPVNYRFDLAKQDSITGTMADSSAAGLASRKQAESIVHTGFLAQDVEGTLKALGYAFDAVVKPQNSTDLYSLAYELFTVPLVKAVQEQQKELEQQRATTALLLKRTEQQQQKIAELKSSIQILLKTICPVDQRKVK